MLEMLTPKQIKTMIRGGGNLNKTIMRLGKRNRSTIKRKLKRDKKWTK